MVQEWSPREEIDLQVVLDALDDESARHIVLTLTEPMTASELSEACDIPLSTTYRKLDLLTEAKLLDERTEIRSDGHHTTRYVVDFEAVTVALNGSESREFDVEISRPPKSPDERLASIWEQVRRET
ncbi:helix-turn-helix domain-containing protein [Halobium salinum]|uniref:Helix-turn-helix domain-containing protein n=1 Tax=Halobium salinum TaxID=1364940 RepID=A0ABD5PGE1_9EURY|nr:helix-turn-helix domain-containing protein [Halobium salinum]